MRRGDIEYDVKIRPAKFIQEVLLVFEASFLMTFGY
jgi:hypothetical protein